MSKQFRSCDLNQAYLLPPSLQDWLPEGHLARFVAEVVEALDLAAIYAKYEAGDGRGLSAYDPRMMVRLLIYGYCRGVASSRRIERATYEDVAFRYLAADQHPDHEHDRRFPAGTPGESGATVRAGVEVVPASGVSEAGTRGAGRDEDQGKCLEA
jgi:transposase